MCAQNIDDQTVAGFGAEWSYFSQDEIERDHHTDFEQYFKAFPWEALPADAHGFDIGCGSGRWARMVAPKVGVLHCIDPSAEALEVTRRNLAAQTNCQFHEAGVDDIPLPDGTMDFGYAIGVLHHVPDTARGLAACARKLKPGAPFLAYIYYAFDNRPAWFRLVWRASDSFRRLISRLPFRLRLTISQVFAVLVYYPLARTSLLLERLGFAVDVIPLSGYRKKSFYSMRTDALDRFGTRLERRFTRSEIQTMMEAAGFEDIVFGPWPYWCAVGHRRPQAEG